MLIRSPLTRKKKEDEEEEEEEESIKPATIFKVASRSGFVLPLKNTY